MYHCIPFWRSRLGCAVHGALIACVGLGSMASAGAQWTQSVERSWKFAAAVQSSTPAQPTVAGAKLPGRVTELKLSEFFVMPVGPRGLEFSEKLRALDGRRVRLRGFMVRQENSLPGAFLLSPFPLALHEHEDHCFIDDLPPSLVHVFVPKAKGPVPFRPGVLQLTGTLSVGSRAEADGRTSLVRLALDSALPNPAVRSARTENEKGAHLLRPAIQRYPRTEAHSH